MKTTITLTEEQEKILREQYKEQIKQELTEEVVTETLKEYSLRRLIRTFANQLGLREDEFQNISLEGLKERFHWDSEREEFERYLALYLYMKVLNLL